MLREVAIIGGDRSRTMTYFKQLASVLPFFAGSGMFENISPFGISTDTGINHATCKQCGRVFTPESFNKQGYCSPDCFKKHFHLGEYKYIEFSDLSKGEVLQRCTTTVTHRCNRRISMSTGQPPLDVIPPEYRPTVVSAGLNILELSPEDFNRDFELSVKKAIKDLNSRNAEIPVDATSKYVK